MAGAGTPGVIVVSAPYDVGTSAPGGHGSARVGPGPAAIPSQEDPLSTTPASVTASVPEGKKLVIVESPAKSKSIAKYLNAVGSGWVVDSSVGHIRDLPKPSDLPADMKKGPFGKFAVDTEHGFTPYYVVHPDKKKKVTELKRKLKDADALYLATDADREGEAIAWHLLETLKPKVPVKRMVFHEITKEAIQRAVEDTRELDLDLVNDIAGALEGHPDNSSASVHGGATLSVTEAAEPLPRTRTVPLRLDPRIMPVVLVPETTLSTHTARAVLPEVVPLATAAANSARTGLLVHALTSAPELLVEATTDLLHQESRRPSYPQSMELVDALRAAGCAATISGAGPSVLVLTDVGRLDEVRGIAAGTSAAWQVLTPGVPTDGVRLLG